ncbi:MAG TPA: AlkA N-terminal domain-containing protein, partial [Xanthomonadales bacterium]|nr:AlkA N-terminal domain-containing protein [Xanthomonadales bacterium]
MNSVAKAVKKVNEVSHAAWEQARQAKDARFDGKFFIAVKTTGIYCRPVCPVKPPKSRNVVFFDTAAAAAEAGFRPCLRCRPESSPGTPAWAGTSATVTRGLRLISDGALDQGSVEALSDRLGVTPRHLSRLFLQHLGASPKAIAQTRRLHFAKKLLDETDLPMTEIALSAGYGSVRRFNDHVMNVYGRTPSMLRNRAPNREVSSFQLKLPYRPPYDFEGVLGFLARRATPGIEVVSPGCYERNIRVGGHAGEEPSGEPGAETGRLIVTHEPQQRALLCEIRIGSSKLLMGVVEKVRRMFDLNADPLEIGACLSRDADLAPLVAANPGLRIPGAWDAFEVLVRAIVGQQISVKGATTVMGKILHEFGETADGVLLFPGPESLARLTPERLPMPRSRAVAIAEVARAVATGEVDLATQDSATLVTQLMRIKGIGEWTAQYVAMRAINDPDAFLHTDLVLRRVANHRLALAT